MQNIIKFLERNIELNGVNLVIIKWDDCMVDDSVIIGESFQGHSVLFVAAMRVYDMDIPFRRYHNDIFKLILLISSFLLPKLI